MNQALFTVEQENMICIVNISSRKICIEELTEVMRYFDDPNLYEIAESSLKILQGMTDAEFTAHEFNPVYDGDKEE